MSKNYAFIKGVNVTTKDNVAEIEKMISTLDKSAAYVGIPEKKASRESTEVNNAELLFIHTHGSPLRGIPKRPVIEPAIELPENKEEIGGLLGEALKAALDGRDTEVKALLHKAGQAGENAARRFFTDPRNGWPPDKPATIRRKKSARPLIDTDQMRKAIIHVVRTE